MTKAFEQLEMDTRTSLETAIRMLADNAISSAANAVRSSSGDALTHCRNRHEAYGIAAEHVAHITSTLKRVKGDMDGLLSTLSDPNRPALEAASDVYNSLALLAQVTLIGAAKMRQTMNDLYDEENSQTSPLPIEQAAEGFENVEAIDGDSLDE